MVTRNPLKIAQRFRKWRLATCKKSKWPGFFWRCCYMLYIYMHIYWSLYFILYLSFYISPLSQYAILCRYQYMVINLSRPLSSPIQEWILARCVSPCLKHEDPTVIFHDFSGDSYQKWWLSGDWLRSNGDFMDISIWKTYKKLWKTTIWIGKTRN